MMQNGRPTQSEKAKEEHEHKSIYQPRDLPWPKQLVVVPAKPIPGVPVFVPPNRRDQDAGGGSAMFMPKS
jgi:hypothetical protein